MAPVPTISALIHICNAGRTLGRTLETLRTADEVVVVDHSSTDDSQRIARQYGARMIAATQDDSSHAEDCRNDWVLCLRPDESIAEALEASILDWKQQNPEPAAYMMAIRAESEAGWRPLDPELRLVDRRRIAWKGPLPVSKELFPLLGGHLLRLR